MHRIVALSAIVLICALTKSAAAQTSEDCSKALIPDTDISKYTNSDRLVLLSQYGQNVTQSQQGSGTVEAVIPADAPIPFKAGINGQAQNNSNTTQTIQINSNSDTLATYAESKLSGANLAAYVACIESHAVGLTIFFTDATNSGATIHAVFNSVSGDPRMFTLTISAATGAAVKNAPSVSGHAPLVNEWAVSRPANAATEMSVTVHAADAQKTYSQDKVLRPIPKPPLVSVWVEKTYPVSDIKYANFHGDGGSPRPPVTAWVMPQHGGQLTSFGTAHFRNQWAAGNGASWAISNVVTGKTQFCATFGCSGPNGGQDNCALNGEVDAVETAGQWVALAPE